MFHLRPLYSKPQNNVLYILARGWFRELHKRCIEARGQRILHTLASTLQSLHLCVGCVHVVRTGGQAGACTGVTPRTCTVTPRVSCVSVYIALLRASFSLALAATREGRVNEIPRAHAFTFRGLRCLSAGDFARGRDSAYVAGVLQ